jgi:hypothetical protein
VIENTEDKNLAAEERRQGLCGGVEGGRNVWPGSAAVCARGRRDGVMKSGAGMAP